MHHVRERLFKTNAFIILFAFLYLLANFASIHCSGIGKQNITEVEIDVNGASDSWKTLQEDEEVPEGMHIKIDLQSGQKMYKPISTSQGKNSDIGKNVVSASNDIAFHESIANIDDGPKTEKSSIESMFDALKKLPKAEQQRLGIDQLSLKNSQDREKVELVWKKRQAEILHIAELMTKPAEILTNIISCLQNSTFLEDEKIKECLEDLEDHLSDIDMARDFHTLGGFPYLWEFVENTDISDQIRSMSLLVIGTATKNTEEMQLYALEMIHSNVSGLQILMDTLLSETSVQILTRALYALGSCLRGNDLVQTHFLALGGAKQLTNSFIEKEHIERKVLLKLITLTHDLISESMSLELSKNNDLQGADGSNIIDNQQHMVPISMIKSQFLNEQNWCKVMMRGFEIPGRKAIEEVVGVMAQLTDVNACISELKEAQQITFILEDFQQSMVESSKDDDGFLSRDDEIILEKIAKLQKYLG